MKKVFGKKKNRIRETFERNDGATIVFALVVFMIATVVSVTIVSAAMSNLRRAESKKSYEQERLAVMSTADYLQSNEPQLNAQLNGLDTAAVGKEWTVSVSGDADAGAALQTTVHWNDVISGSSLTAEISSGEYSAEVKMSYDVATSKWSVTKMTKK
ncbi:MAG: hypothetical protein K6F37_09235 [Lachnospiraceae bacterium]|nr:hypothetical protein [Lachnospiraceae bacterium]